MASHDLLLGLDIGSSSLKAVLLDGDGRVGASSVAVTPFEHTPGHEGNEQVEMPADALLHSVAEVLDGLGAARRQVVAVGVAGMAESGVPRDADARSLAPVIAWHDARGADVVARLEERFGESLASQIGQRVRPVATVAKLGWLVDHGVSGVRRWLGVPELCVAALTDVEVTEFSLAARTGCYDVLARRLLPEVADAVGVSADVFPPVAAAGEVMGRVSGGAASWSGLARGIPVTIAGHDHLAGMVGAGAGNQDVANSVGTAETVLSPTPTPDVPRALAVGAAVTVAPGGRQWAVLASAVRAGIFLEAAAKALGSSPSHLDDLAAECGAIDLDAGKALLEAVRQGGATPGHRSDTTAGPVWAGVLWELAARTWGAVDRLQQVVGPRNRLVVFGGGSSSEPWLRAKASAGALPVWHSAAAGNAVARGAALYAGVAAGWWPQVDGAPVPQLRAV